MIIERKKCKYILMGLGIHITFFLFLFHFLNYECMITLIGDLENIEQGYI